MNKIILIIIVILFFSNPALCQDGINYSTPVINGVKVHLIKVNNNSSYVTPIVPKSFDAIQDIYPLTGMDEIIKTYNPEVLINGTYFDMDEGRTIGNIVIDGKLVNEGYNGSAICICHNSLTDFILFTGCIGRYLDLNKYRSVITSGPTLVYKGKPYYFSIQEGHDDPGLYRATRRSVLGITEDGRILIVGIEGSVTLKETAFIMKDLGAYYASNLDGGTSSGLYVKGKYLMKPGRPVSNFIGVFNSKPANLYVPPSLTDYFKYKQEKEADELTEEGKKCLQSGYYWDSLSYFTEACEKDQDNPLRYLNMADVYNKLGDYTGESKFIAKASMVYLQGGFISISLFYANKSLEIDKNNDLGKEIIHLCKYKVFLLGGMYMFRHDYEKGKECFLKSIESEPEEPRFYYGLASSYWKLGQKEIASDTFVRSYQLFLKKGLPYDAYCAAINGVRVNPHNKEAQVALSEIAIKREKYDTACVHLQIAHMLEPADKNVINMLTNLGVYVAD